MHAPQLVSLLNQFWHLPLCHGFYLLSVSLRLTGRHYSSFDKGPEVERVGLHFGQNKWVSQEVCDVGHAEIRTSLINHGSQLTKKMTISDVTL